MSLMKLLENLLYEDYKPFIFSNAVNFGLLNTRPLGTDPMLLQYDKPENVEFSRLFLIMNGLSFGEKDMAMPNWVFVDLGCLPSGFVGFCLPKRKVPQELREKADIHDYDGHVPVAAYCAVPTPETGRWIGYSLWSTIPGRNLALLSKALGVDCYKPETVDGVTQYDNPSLKIHSAFGKLRLRAAVVYTHTLNDMTFVYSTETDFSQPNAIANALARRYGEQDAIDAASFLLDPYDSAKKREMHSDILQGRHHYSILPPGHVKVNEKLYVPIEQL